MVDKDMGAQKHGSKGVAGGGYVGGFLHLFDWNAKSRKKLFSSKLESPEQPKQKKRTDNNMPMTRFNMMDEDDMIGAMSVKGSSDYSCATSVTDDDGYGTKAPGVIARLMGLDSLPTVNFSDSYSNPSFDSQSLRDSSTSYIIKEPEYDPIDCQMEPVSRPLKVKPQNMAIGRAIEKFQTETLPPRSAKSIPITHNKLLSPIKSSGFVSSSNPARIMEAASKIRLVGSVSSSPLPSSSIPFRVKNSREKIDNPARKPKIPEPIRRPPESTNVKNVKSQQSVEPKKSISLALQAKANVQKRKGLNHRGQLVRTQSNPERNSQKNHVSSNVLKHNTQKQNSLVDRGKSSTKSSCSTSGPQPRKPISQKTSHKKEPYSTTRRKRSMEESKHNNDQTEKSSSVGDRNYKSNRSDVVSFTFTAPIARPMTSNNGVISNNRLKTVHDSSSNASNASSLTYNVIGSDALSTLLDQKLRELNGNSKSVSKDSLLATETEVRDDLSDRFSSYKPHQDQEGIARSDSSYEFATNEIYTGRNLVSKDASSYGFSSTNPQEPMFRDYEYKKYLLGNQPSPNSVLEASFITESCNSSYTADSCKQNSTSVHAFSGNPSPMDVDTDLTDSASSITTVTKWEADYVKEVLANIETMFVDFTIGKTRKLVNPRVFEQLEFGKPSEEVIKLRRELMFDCVSECMETRCRVWVKGLAAVRRRTDLLAQEVYGEIAGWEEMRDCMVDELIDMDMTGHDYKKWLDFDVEAIEIGVEIESRLLDSLINEIVDDILVL
ncbi:hypothetical protein QVD17_02130 [Tagetes erecta]|uniref:DUF4378 domain-containing protein n=1 Tax=Tagetes erecta TaxID=13708 RepID=A0AAD8P8W4_TARER|nr:hypothetical protein QVD17_02130 [Tagetes erecta]